MRQIVGAIVERYRNSPALWAWEFGNEANLPADLPNAAQVRKPGGTEDLRGHLRLVPNGEAICDRPLAKGIEDSYQKWASDPRFGVWKTNQYMRAALGAEDLATKP